MSLRRPVADRFWSKVDKNGPIHPTLGTPCWIWTGAKDERGYGRLGVGSVVDGTNTMARTHRLSWTIHNGPIPEGVEVCHHCDNPSCPNPEHLFLGVHADNMADMAAKGRAWNPVAQERRTRTHCLQEHEFTPENTYFWRGSPGQRICRACRRDRMRQRRRARRAVA